MGTFRAVFQLSVVKPKLNQSKDGALANQSEFEPNTCSWYQAQEYACEEVTIGFWFCFSLVENVARVLPTNQKA